VARATGLGLGQVSSKGAAVTGAAPVNASNRVQQEPVWDPFGRRQKLTREEVVPAYRQVVAVPGWFLKLSVGLAALCMAATVIGLAIGAETFGAAFILPTVAFSMIFAVAGYLNGQNVEEEKKYFRLAERKGWAFRRVQEDKNQVGVPKEHEYLSALVRPRPGQLIPMVPKAQFWGVTTARKTGDEIPFWMVAGDIATFDKSRTRSTIAQSVPHETGSAGNSGVTYTVLVAYDLNRDSGIRAQLLAETPGLDSRRDVQTESVQFNRTFHISILNGPDDAGSKQNLLRLLTPATQDVMLQLWEAFRAQFIFNGPTVFMSGYFSMMTRDEAVLEAHIDELLDAFAQAAMSFKHYAE